MENCILVTGGAGFIGSNFVLDWLASESAAVITLDNLSYAGNLHNLDSVQHDLRCVFVRGDIGDRELVRSLLAKHRPGAVVHFAAESHVDRSILGPEQFIRTNVQGTFVLLDEARQYWQELRDQHRQRFRFLHVSTDEVYGSLWPGDPAFTESTPYAPNSPYAASKACSDHLVRAYHHTYGLPTLTTNCSNNYGPRQFPEKLIPLMVLNAVKWLLLPVYGDGRNVRDWLYVKDHCEAIRTVLRYGRPGQTYNIGGRQEVANIEVVRQICAILDVLRPNGSSHSSLITYVKDRPGHDRRYAMNIDKIEAELGWRPRESFNTGLQTTVQWYLDNLEWVQEVTSGAYRDWVKRQYSAMGAH